MAKRHSRGTDYIYFSIHNRKVSDIVSSHLIDRYRERFGTVSGYSSISEQFFCRTTYAISGRVTSIEGRWHGSDYEMMSVIPDGVMLGISDDGRNVVWKTFLTEKDMTDPMKKRVNELAKQLRVSMMASDDNFMLDQ